MGVYRDITLSQGYIEMPRVRASGSGKGML